MEKIYDSPLLGGEKKAILCFALGKAYDDINNSENILAAIAVSK